MKFPNELMIEYKNNEIKNKEEIVHFIESVEKKELISEYLKVLNMLLKENKINKEEVKYLIDACNKKLTSKIELKNTVEETKKVNPNFLHISILETKKENNDKINGYSKDINYIKYTFGEKTKIYEVTNEKALLNFLMYNQDKIKLMSEEELLNELSKYCTELKQKEIDNRQNDKFNLDSLKKEIDEIDDPTVKEAFIKDQNNVLKERIKLIEFNKHNNSEKNIKYALNSLGERIYIIGDITIKFEGFDRNMKIIDESGEKKNNINTNNFSNYDTSSEELTDEIKYDNNYNYELIESIITAIEEGKSLTDVEIKHLESFLDWGVTQNEDGISNEREYQILFDKYYEMALRDHKYVLNDNIRQILERHYNNLNRVETKEDASKTNENVKQLKLENNNNYGSGFVVTTVILEVSLLLGAILAIIILVK